MSNFYYDPKKFGLETIGEIQWGEPCHNFDLTVVWKRLSDGVFVYGSDSGCSCPSPFEDQGVQDLTVLPQGSALNAFKEYCDTRNANEQESWGHADQSSDIAALLERMHAAGAR